MRRRGVIEIIDITTTCKKGVSDKNHKSETSPVIPAMFRRDVNDKDRYYYNSCKKGRK
jgi:hypothetical protein